MNLSKAFDTLNPDLLLAKLEAYGLHNHSEFYKMLPKQIGFDVAKLTLLHFGE